MTGLNAAAALADRLNIPLQLRPIAKPFIHFFGPEGNSTSGKWTVAEWLLPVRFEDGFRFRIPVSCVLGNDPVLLGGAFLASCVLDNPGNKLSYRDKHGKTHACRTYRHKDGHRYLEAAPREQGQQRYAYYQSPCKTLQEKKRFVSMLHNRTHATPASLRMLLQRNGIWDRRLQQHTEAI